jgi:hypothetical protein
VIAFAEREQRRKKRVARAASLRIRLAPDCMAGGVNEERAVLEHDNFCNATNEKATERADPPVPEKNQPASADQSPPAPLASEYVDVATQPTDLSLHVYDGVDDRSPT